MWMCAFLSQSGDGACGGEFDPRGRGPHTAPHQIVARPGATRRVSGLLTGVMIRMRTMPSLSPQLARWRRLSMALLAAAGLAACAANGVETTNMAPAQVGDPVAASPPPLPAAGRAARAAQAPPPEPMTRTRANEQCWMESENAPAARKLTLDQKAKFVETCVDRRMKAELGR